MQAIILAGGLGTRLKNLVPDLPKPMAPIHDKPFLAYLLQYLSAQGITRVVISVHYLKEKIQHYFQFSYAGIEIIYAEEKQLLGTGGAIAYALSILELNQSRAPVFVLNGDTFVKLNYAAMYRAHQSQHALITMALAAVADCSRYGKVEVKNNRVVGFQEKGKAGKGLINAGVYLIQPHLFAPFDLPPVFSIEQDFLFPYLEQLRPYYVLTDHYFIDIGLPADYLRALHELNVITQN